jgi:L-lactate dehydrogenase complex protein LldF
VYPGPIGSIVTPLMLGPTNAPKLPYASSLCGACQAACPVEIAIPDMLLKLRRDLVQAGDPTPAWRAGIRAWEIGMKSPRLYRLGSKMASLATRMLAGKSGKIRSLPPPFNAWTDSRDFPPFAREPFRERWNRRSGRHANANR